MANNSPKHYDPKDDDAFYIRIKEVMPGASVKEGSIWLVWSGKQQFKRDQKFRTRDNTEIGGANAAKIVHELASHIVAHMVETSKTIAGFPPFVSSKDRKKQEAEVKKALNEQQQQAAPNAAPSSAQQPQQTKTASNTWATQGPKIAAQTTQTNTPKGAAGKGSSMVRATAKPKDWSKDEGVHFYKLDDKETKTLFVYAYKWRKATTTGVEKAWARWTEDEKFDYMTDFVEKGLSRRSGVKDDEIPPLPILKKLSPPLSEDMVIYYERKLNRRSVESDPLTFKNGIKFNLKAMPTSFRLAAGVGRLALGAARLAIKTPGAVSETMRSLSSQASDIKERVHGGALASADWLQRTGSKLRERGAAASSWTRTRAGELGNALVSKEDRDTNSQILKGIWDELKKHTEFEKKQDTKSKEHKAENIEGKDVDMSTPDAKNIGHGHESAPEEKKGGSIFSRILGWLKPLSLLKSLVSGLGKSFGVLRTLLSGAGSAIAGLLKNLGASTLARTLGSSLTSIAGRGLMALGGSAAAVAGAGYAGYKIGEAINEKYGLSDKISDFAMKHTTTEKSEAQKAQDSQLEATWKKRMLDAGVPKEKVEAWHMGQDVPDEFKKKNQVKAKPQETKSAAATPSPAPNQNVKQMDENEAAMRSQIVEARQEIIETSQKKKASQIEAAQSQNEAIRDAKEDKKTQQIINASRDNNTTIVQQGNAPRIYPRTTNSTFQRFLSSRAVY